MFKMKRHLTLRWGCVLAAGVTVVALSGAAEETAGSARAPILYVIGDSTAASYEPDRAPLTGWAQVLQEYFDPNKLKVVNKARSGRSSKSFLNEGAWGEIQALLQPGDYVLIQFGHNDSKKKDPKRFTDPETSYRAYLNTYMDETLAKGAIPILATSIHRNLWKSDAGLEDTMGGYPSAVRNLARERGILMVDAWQRTRELFEGLGRKGTTALFMNLSPGAWPNYPEGKEDNTHLQESGARAVCNVIVEELAKLDPVFKGALVLTSSQVSASTALFVPTGSKKEEESYGAYIVRTYEINGDSSEGSFEIIKNGIRVYAAYGYSFHIGTFCNDGKVHSLVSMGSDITGCGQPNLVVSEFTGGGHCCFRINIFEIGSRFQLIQTIDAAHGDRAHFENVDDDSALEFLMNDWSFANWRYCFAETHAPAIILKYQGEKYKIAVDVMRKPGVPKEILVQVADDMKTLEEWKKDAAPPPPAKLFAKMLDLIYTGNMSKAWELLHLSWPTEIEGKEHFLKEFEARLRKSVFWEDIQQLNK